MSADYFRTLGIPLRAGRGADARAIARDGPPVAVVNETGARRFWPGENPIGKRVWFGTTTGPFSDRAHAVEIVGVVGDVKYDGIGQPMERGFLHLVSAVRVPGHDGDRQDTRTGGGGRPGAAVGGRVGRSGGADLRRDDARRSDRRSAGRGRASTPRSSPPSPAPRCCWRRSASTECCRIRSPRGCARSACASRSARMPRGSCVSSSAKDCGSRPSAPRSGSPRRSPREARAEPAPRGALADPRRGRCRRHHHAGRVGRGRFGACPPRQRGRSDDRAPEGLNRSGAEFRPTVSTSARQALYTSP